MLKKQLISLALSLIMIITTLGTAVVVSAAPAEAAADTVAVDFTAMSAVPVYSAAAGQGFVSVSGTIMPAGSERKVAPAESISLSAENGASVTESDGSYLSFESDYLNYGGMIYRFDVDPGAYHLEVEVADASKTVVAPTGLNAANITTGGTWDNPGLVPKKSVAAWNGNVWSYDFATGENFVEVEIEPSGKPSASSPQTVSVKSIKLTPIAKNPAGQKPTIHILGDSTQKTYTFNETISSWGQTLRDYYDADKVNVINYSMGGRCMKNNYVEGRANDILVNGSVGDFVFIHSAHNDEKPAETRFDRGSQVTGGTLEQNNALYQRWLDMYVNAIKARGMTPVLVSAVPRGSGKPTENVKQPNGFNPDAPGLMRAKAASDPEVGYAELYKGAKEYIAKLGTKEGQYIYNNIESGETPAENSANGGSGDGTHYKESCARQFSRIIQQSIYDQSVAETDTYNDKPIMQRLVSYMPESVKTAAASGDWSAVFPEAAVDVSAVDIVPGAVKQAESAYYYRNNIEKALQIGALHKNSAGEFKPTQTITVGEFARGIETVFGLKANSLTSYNKNYAELLAEYTAPAKAAAAAEEEPEVVVSAPEFDASAAADQCTVTVQQPGNGLITIYNNSALDTATVDVPKGVKAGQVLGDNEYFKLTAPPENIVSKSSSAKFTDNKEITGNYVEFRNANPEKIVTYDAKASGIISVYCNAASNKPIECVSDDKTQTGSVSGDGVVEFTVEAGKSYKLWTRGGTGKLYGVKYESNDYPQSTESLTVNTGDSIFITAKPENGYLVKAITVNGTPVSTEGSCIVEAKGPMTVSADFRAEPELVAETKIASDAALTREAMGAILYDAYLAAYGKKEDGSWNKVDYMNQTGSVPTPDDPNYDPNIKYEGATYLPLVGWGALTDIHNIDDSLYRKVKEAYDLGLMRSEKGAARGRSSAGDEIEPKKEVTRAKAAKTLTFCFILTQPLKGESQTIPGGINHGAETAEIAAVNPLAPSTPNLGPELPYVITKAEFNKDGALSAELSYLGSEQSPKAKLIAASYDKNDEQVLLSSQVFDVEGTAIKDLSVVKDDNAVTKLMVWDGMDTMVPLSAVVTATVNDKPEPTPVPTEAPTATPTPTPAPTVDPSLKGVTVEQKGVQVGEKYASIRDAVAAAKALNPSSEADRVTINVNPGYYEEQVMIENMKFVTLQQTPGTENSGRVHLYWHYCTGYCAGDCGLDGRYDPKINWSDPRTWTGYKEGDEQFTPYRLGQVLTKGSTISYYDTDGVAHKDVKVQKDHLGDFTDQAALFISKESSDIIVKDFNIVNSIPVMVTEGEKAVGLAPQEDRNADHATSYVLPRRDNLAVCSEDTPMEATDRVKKALAIKDDVEKVKALEALTDLTPGESAYLARSDKYNERGHAVSANGDKIIFDGIRLRGNQDSLYISSGRIYFKECDLIGGTDYIYGDATAVFDSCKLGAEGMSNKSYGATVTAANHDPANPYGYLFYNCELYNVLDNITTSQFGRPWRPAAQITFYKTLIDDTKTTGASKAGISPKGWSDMSGNEMKKARFFEYGTYTRSGAAVDTSKRLVNASVEEGGQGFGSVVDDWQILEFNPRNYFTNSYQQIDLKREAWDPMDFGNTSLKEVDAAIAGAAVTVPEGAETTVALPAAPEGIEFKWASNSRNAVITDDGKLEVIRPAAGMAPIESSVILYARNTATGFGDKKEVSVTINPTSDTTNVFNIPVKISQSVLAENTYTITIEKNGALIKEQEIVMPADKQEIQAVVENIPVGEYDVDITSKSDDITVTQPSGGGIVLSGTKGEAVPLDIIAQKIVDQPVPLDITTTSKDGDKTYDLIALAKAAGVDAVETSDVVKVSFDITVNAKPSKSGFIDITAGKPSDANSAVGDRYANVKINNSWVQLDSVDCSQGYGGSSNGEGQYLNLTGKFSYPSTHNVTVIIDYKAGTVSVSGNNGEPYTFAHFPKTGEKGKVNMGVLPGSKSDDYTVSNVRVIYKKVVTGDEPAEVIPEGEGVYEYPGNGEYVSGGNLCTDADVYSFVEGANEQAKAFFADPADPTKVKSSLTANYINYIGGTAGTHPAIKFSKAGKYRMFYLGFNSDKSDKTFKVGEVLFKGSEGVDFASSGSKVLKLYTFDVEVPASQVGSLLTFDASSQWLPDMYSVVAVGSKDLGL